MTLERKRNSIDEMGTHTQGVGARHKDHPPTSAGGGYLDICTKNAAPLRKNERDPRLDELQAMGVGLMWMDVAEDLGYDKFVAMWRILDKYQPYGEPESRLRVYIPRYRTLERFQRNRYIRSLGDEGLHVKEIKNRLSLQLDEDLSEKQISRVLSQ